MPKTEACEVCGAPASCIGSAKYICKSCSTFYRRTYGQYGTLKCRRNANCQINETERTICRACRLQKCRDVGLRMAGKNLIVQFNGYPEHDLDIFDENVVRQSFVPTETEKQCDNGIGQFTAASSFPSSHFTDCNQQPQNSNGFYEHNTQRIPSQFDIFQMSEEEYTAEFCLDRAQKMLKEFPNNKYPMLSKVVDAFLQFERRQRFLSAMHQNKEIVEGELTKLTHQVQGQMEGSTNRIACMFVMEILSGCDLTPEQRVSILKSASLQVAMSHKGSLNASRFFPKIGDTRVCSFIGLYYDTQDLEMFFHGLQINENCIEIIRPICEAGQKATDKNRHLRPNIIESIFMMGVVLFEEIERQLIFNKSVQERHDQFYADFTAYQINAYGGDAVAAGARLIRLTSGIYENKTMTVSQEEMYSVADIFMPGFREKYHDYIKTGNFQFNVTPYFPSEDFVQKIICDNLNL